MIKYTAVLSGIDTHPANSIALMLRSVGYRVVMLNDKAIEMLQKRGYTGGVKREMLDEMGYDQPNVDAWVDETALETCELFVDLKTKDIDSAVALYPRLKERSVHFLINGGRDDYENAGFSYPVVTANQWVQGQAFKCYLPFENIHNLEPRRQLERREMKMPIGLLHNAWNWGFRSLIPDVIRETGLLIYGHYNSPAGMLPNNQIKEKLETAQCFVHMKANDCPGYALYEAFAAGIPIVLPELMIHRMRYGELFINRQTCLTWGATSFKIEEDKILEFMDREKENMVKEIDGLVRELRDPEFNYKLGLAGHQKWKQLTDWTTKKRDDFRHFLKENHIKCE